VEPPGWFKGEQTNSDGILTRADGTIQADNHVKKSYSICSQVLQSAGTSTKSTHLIWPLAEDRQPTYQDLNPFENKLDELTYEKGNAFLRPQYTNNVELTHTFMGFLNTSAGYSLRRRLCYTE
jgi:hypothetical protein